mmetsp:Transcript_5094/g.11067  ORF Transcript_5094/g.11067 Transcript_5094/m.11067 type:complete len:724 (+) Transcript_5094:238-2409(+)
MSASLRSLLAWGACKTGSESEALLKVNGNHEGLVPGCSEQCISSGLIGLWRHCRRSLDVAYTNYSKVDSIFSETLCMRGCVERVNYLMEQLVKSKLVSFACISLVNKKSDSFAVLALNGVGSHHFPPALCTNSQVRQFSLFPSSAFTVAGSNWSVEDVLSTGIPLYYDCSSGSTGLPQEAVWLKRCGIRSMLSLPCAHQGRIYGVLTLGIKAVTWDQLLVRKLHELAYRMTPYVVESTYAMSRAMSQKAVRRFESTNDIAAAMIDEMINLDKTIVSRITASAQAAARQPQANLPEDASITVSNLATSAGPLFQLDGDDCMSGAHTAFLAALASNKGGRAAGSGVTSAPTREQHPAALLRRQSGSAGVADIEADAPAGSADILLSAYSRCQSSGIASSVADREGAEKFAADTVVLRCMSTLELSTEEGQEGGEVPVHSGSQGETASSSASSTSSSDCKQAAPELQSKHEGMAHRAHGVSMPTSHMQTSSSFSQLSAATSSVSQRRALHDSVLTLPSSVRYASSPGAACWTVRDSRVSTQSQDAKALLLGRGSPRSALLHKQSARSSGQTASECTGYAASDDLRQAFQATLYRIQDPGACAGPMRPASPGSVRTMSPALSEQALQEHLGDEACALLDNSMQHLLRLVYASGVGTPSSRYQTPRGSGGMQDGRDSARTSARPPICRSCLRSSVELGVGVSMSLSEAHEQAAGVCDGLCEAIHRSLQ